MNIWDLEYTKLNKIPSSNTYHPSSSLREFLKKYPFRNASVLDIGCGNGRNSFYCLNNGFSKAVGFDISSEAIKLANMKAKELDVDDKTEFYIHNLNTPLAEKDKSFDLIIDMTTTHLLDDLQYKNYLKELKRLIKDHGYILIYTIEDNRINNKICYKVLIDQNNSFRYYLRNMENDLLDRFNCVQKSIYQGDKTINERVFNRTYAKYIICHDCNQ